MALFTFVATYKGRRAIRQIQAGSVQEAAGRWVESLPSDFTPELTEADHEEVVDHFDDDNSREEALCSMEKCKGVWSIHLLDTAEEMLEAYVIRTHES